jgi:hypothetical protein
MQVITIGKRLVPAEHIAFVEAFDPAINPDFKPERDFKGRVVLVNRDTSLCAGSFHTAFACRPKATRKRAS